MTSSSYPILSIARKYGVDYGALLHYHEITMCGAVLDDEDESQVAGYDTIMDMLEKMTPDEEAMLNHDLSNGAPRIDRRSRPPAAFIEERDRLARFVNARSGLVGLLYDGNMLPEQCASGLGLTHLLVVCMLYARMERFEKILDEMRADGRRVEVIDEAKKNWSLE